MKQKEEKDNKEKKNKKKKYISKKIWDFLYSQKYLICFFIITVIAVLVRKPLMYFVSADFSGAIQQWFDELKRYGGIYALDRSIGNYNPPYITVLALLTYLNVKALTSVKIFSIVFDFICALAAMKIVNITMKTSKDKEREIVELLIYAAVLFLPTVILNSACWGQADSIYTAFILMSIVCLLEKKYIRAFILLGISFAFKLQFALILPLYILIYINERKMKIYDFLFIPLMYYILCLPALLMGKSLANCLGIYKGQLNQGAQYLSMNFPGVWNLIFPIEENSNGYVMCPDKNITTFGIWFTIAIFAVMACIVFYKKIRFNKETIIDFSLWTILISTFFLPHMHDRYLYIGDILSVLYLIYNRKRIFVPIGVSLVSIYGYSVYLFSNKVIPIQIVSVIFLIIVIVVTNDIYNKHLRGKKEEKEMEQISKGIEDVRKNK